jgi:hypothetical protein
MRYARDHPEVVIAVWNALPFSKRQEVVAQQTRTTDHSPQKDEGDTEGAYGSTRTPK